MFPFVFPYRAAKKGINHYVFGSLRKARLFSCLEPLKNVIFGHENGAGKEIRTLDLLVGNESLYH